MATETATWEGMALAGGRYRVTAKLGEGGMGFVYRARDCNLDTEVVIKVPRRAMLDDPEFAGRFSREICSLVQLTHPHIVKIQEVGEQDGLPFAVMQFLAGGNLRDRQPRGPDGLPRSQSPGQLSTWLLPIAETLDFIHRKGYIHRDVKPDNILFDGDGHAFISDFGVAKALSDNRPEAKRTVVTGSGMVLGTPQYMAPELILGQTFDGRVDQYALAVTVFEMLAGRLPFDGATPTAIFVQQTSNTPPLLRTFCPAVSDALAAAVRKGMAKEPGQRYSDCAAFARAVLEGASASAAVASVAPAPSQTPAAKEAFACPCPSCAKMLRLPAASRGRQVRCPSCKTVFPVPAVAATAAAAVVSRTITAAQARIETPTRGSGGTAAHAALPQSGPSQGLAPQTAAASIPVLEEADLSTPLSPPLASSSSFKKVMLGGVAAAAAVGLLIGLGVYWFWGKTEEPVAPVQRSASLEISPLTDMTIESGKSDSLEIQVRRQEVAGPIGVAVKGWPGTVSPKQPRIEADKNSVRVNFTAPPESVGAEAEVQIVAQAGEVKSTAKLKITIRPAPARPPVLVKIPDSLDSPPPDPGSITMTIEPSQLNLKPGAKKNVHITIERRGCKGAVKIRPQRLPINVVARSIDLAADQSEGDLTFSAGNKAHKGNANVTLIATLQESKVTAQVSLNLSIKARTFRIPAVQPEPLTLNGHKGTVWSVAYSTELIASGGADRTVRFWNPQTGQEKTSIPGQPGAVHSVVFSPDGERLATTFEDHLVKLWDVKEAKVLFTLSRHAKPVTSAAFSPDGLRLITGSGFYLRSKERYTSGEVKIWNTLSGTEMQTFRPQSNVITSVAFSPLDGNRFATGSTDGTVRLAASGNDQQVFRNRHGNTVFCLAFSPDGSRLASGSSDMTIKLWDPNSGQLLATLRGHKGYITAVAFSPDGAYLASASEDHTVKLWNVASGLELLTLKGHTDQVRSVAFSPDGKRIASASKDQTVKVWELPADED
jgi:WD40 repeat protein